MQLILVLLVLMLGATVYLWRARYIRRRAAYVAIGFFVLALIAVGRSIYLSAG